MSNETAGKSTINDRVQQLSEALAELHGKADNILDALERTTTAEKNPKDRPVRPGPIGNILDLLEADLGRALHLRDKLEVILSEVSRIR